MNREQLKVLDNSLMQNGVNQQLMVCMEEPAELIQAISKVERYPDEVDRIENVVEEIADVSICIEYLKMIYNIDQSEVDEMISQKINRIKERMN